MPTIFLIGPFKIVIYTNDHAPAHVHCIAGDIEVLIMIETREVIKNKNNRAHSSDIKRLQKFIAENEEILMNEWRHYHGEE